MTSTSPGYRAYSPRPMTRDERDRVEILFGGLHWRAERVIQAVFENLGYHARPLPPATKSDLLLGRELADIGQCCPTSFTTGNLANFLRSEASRIGRRARRRQIRLRDRGLVRRLPLRPVPPELRAGAAQSRAGLFPHVPDRAEQARPGPAERRRPGVQHAADARLRVGDPVHRRACRASNIKTRPYEVVQGQTDEVVRESVDYLCDVFRKRPHRGRKWGAFVWHLSTDYFVNALREVLRKNSTRSKSTGCNASRSSRSPASSICRPSKATPTTTSTAGWRRRERRSIPRRSRSGSIICIRFYAQISKNIVGIDRFAGANWPRSRLCSGCSAGPITGMRAALGNIPHELPDQYELRRLAAPYFHHRLSGGEGDMLVGKALWAHLHKKAHMICELSPYACMPNTMSIGAMAGVIGKHPDLLYAPIEIKGDAEVHALSRCQMILTEAKKRADREYVEAMEKTSLTPEDGKICSMPIPA